MFISQLKQRWKKMKIKKIGLIGWISIFLFLVMAVVGFNYSHLGSNLAGGAFNNTLYNSTLQAVQLNWTDGTNTTYVSEGEYISSVIDFGQNSTFVRLEWQGKPGTCPENMTYIDKLGGFCIDKYEASVEGCENIGINCRANYTSYCDACSSGSYSGVFGGVDSYTGTTVNASSRPNAAPFVQVSQKQARQMCANAGKYLCTSEEWLAAANLKGIVWNLPADLSANPYNCNTNSACSLNASAASNRACLAMNRTGCVSSEGVYDMVGNVWEWVNDTVTAIAPSGTAGWYYPSDSGFYTSTNANTTKYGNDGVYFAAGTQTGRAVRRGGSWGDGAAAGPFCAALRHGPSIVYPAVGFRCCRSAS